MLQAQNAESTLEYALAELAMSFGGGNDALYRRESIIVRNAWQMPGDWLYSVGKSESTDWRSSLNAGDLFLSIAKARLLSWQVRSDSCDR
jgi:hypothetical protein